MNINIGISNRHVHLKKEHLDILFGLDYNLTHLKDINQPGQFACKEKVTLKTDKDIIDNVRVLGPIRPYTQVEISKTDAFKLGLNPPIRKSGDLKGSESVTIIGPNGTLTLDECCIIADRHIHITSNMYKELGFEVNEVSLKIGGSKGGILDHVKLRVADNSYFEAHLDTDDANAFLIEPNDIAEIIIKK